MKHPKQLLLVLGLIFSLSCRLLTGSTTQQPGEMPPSSPLEPSASMVCPLKDTKPPSTTEFFPAGKVYYVAANDPHASDDNNGHFAEYQSGFDGPWLTVQHAAKVMRAGDTTFIRQGVYYEAGITFARSGSPDAPVALVNYPGEEVVLDGSKASQDLPGIAILPGQAYYLIQGLTIRNMPWSGIATDAQTVSLYLGITIRDCILHHNGWSGIDLAAVEDFLVEGVDSYANQYYGLNISGSEDGALSAANGVVRNSYFYHHTQKEGHGLAVNQGHGIVLSGNTACHNQIHGFDISDWPKSGDLSYDILLESNRSYDNGVAGFSINSDSHHVVYRNNIAWRNGAAWAGKGTSSGFLCYEGCWHIEWLNNVAWGNSDAGFFVEDLLGYYSTPGDQKLIFTNNIADANGNPGSEERPALVVKGTQWEIVALHNNWAGAAGENALVVGVNLVGEKGDIFSRDRINDGAFQSGNLSLDPQFIDPWSAIWQLQDLSPMIDAGVDVGQPFCGSAPDMGAFESCP